MFKVIRLVSKGNASSSLPLAGWQAQSGRNPTIVAIMLALVLALGGCASVVYAPLATDSPQPQPSAPMCKGTLGGPGQRCLALIQANQVFSNTGLRVEPRQVYKVEVPHGQVWFDGDRRNVPPKGEPGSPIMNLARQLRRDNSDWFTLMAAVTDLGVKQVRSCNYDLFANPEIHVQHHGALTMFPNDALPQIFYDNNRGQVWVFIERLPDDAMMTSRGTNCG